MNAIVVFIVGAPNIGKTQLLTTLTGSESCDVGPTLGIEMRSWAYKHMEKVHRFRLWDVSGQSTFSQIVSVDIQYGDVSILCYDTLDASTLVTMKRWLTLVEQSAEKQHIILCGLIRDGGEREVMPSDIHSIAEHARGRGNLKSAVAIETRVNERAPLFRALVGIAVRGMEKSI